MIASAEQQDGAGQVGEQSQLAAHQSPEARELEKKRAELASLESRLAEAELDLADLQGSLRAFEQRYLRTVGIHYAELDEIEAQIAELQAAQRPGDTEAAQHRDEARTRARESAESIGEAPASDEAPQAFEPSPELKDLYRRIAKAIHPDLSTDPKERQRRQKLMAQANRAYQEGDADRLAQILHDWQDSPDSVQGEGPGAELIRTIRKIAQAESRIAAIEQEMETVVASDLHDLMATVAQAVEEGRDLLQEMASEVRSQVAAAKARLLRLQEAMKEE